MISKRWFEADVDRLLVDVGLLDVKAALLMTKKKKLRVSG